MCIIYCSWINLIVSHYCEFLCQNWWYFVELYYKSSGIADSRICQCRQLILTVWHIDLICPCESLRIKLWVHTSVTYGALHLFSHLSLNGSREPTSSGAAGHQGKGYGCETIHEINVLKCNPSRKKYYCVSFEINAPFFWNNEQFWPGGMS